MSERVSRRARGRSEHDQLTADSHQPIADIDHADARRRQRDTAHISYTHIPTDLDAEAEDVDFTETGDVGEGS